jgi:hypothetical protein
MKRRDFFRQMGMTTAAAVVVPAVVMEALSSPSDSLPHQLSVARDIHNQFKEGRPVKHCSHYWYRQSEYETRLRFEERLNTYLINSKNFLT